MYKLLLAASLFLLAACSDSGDKHAAFGADTAIAPPADRGSAPRELELVYFDSTYQLTGVAKEDSGGLLVSYPRWSDTYLYAVVIAYGAGGKIPYPDATMNSWQPGQPGRDKWVCVQSVYFDDQSNPWVLDPAAPQLKQIQGNGAKLVKMSSQTGRPERIYDLSGVLADTSYANDVRVDVARNFAYISESKGGGIVVVDLTNGKMRRVLAGHPSTLSDPAFRFVIDGQELMKNGKPVRINSDGIALNPDGSYLYYKPLTDDKLYRIPTEVLRNGELGDSAIAARVEDLGHFTTTDGMIFDRAGNLYLGDLQHNRIMRISPAHQMTELIRDDRILWPDSYSIADGHLYFSCSQIHKQPEYNKGINKRTTPYAVYRVRL